MQSGFWRRVLLALLLPPWGGGLPAQAPEMPRPLVVGVDADYFPFEFGDAEGRAGGFSVELLRAIGRNEGLAFDFRTEDWAPLRTGLNGGHVDLMSGMFRSRSREATLAFSEPHMVVDYVIFAGPEGAGIRTLGDLRDRRVAVQDSTLPHEYLLETRANARIVPVASERKALRALAEGAADAALLTQLGGNALLHEMPLGRIRQTSGPLLTFDYCFAVPKERRELLGRLNAGLARLRASGEYELIRRQWFGLPQGSSRVALLRGLALWAGLPLLLLGTLGALWIWALRRQVARSTRELRQQQEHLEEIVALRTSELRQALDEVKTLTGLIPICASCKKVRDDQGFWTQVEDYLHRNSDLTFTHGLCPDCLEKMFPGCEERRRNRQDRRSS